jgi:hypothetical protein
LLSYLIQHNEDRSFQYFPIEDNADIIGIFNATEDAMPKDSPEVFELVWESFLSPPSCSILDADPKAKALQQEWLHRRLISAAHDGALRTAALIIEKYKANPNHISTKYHYTPLFLTAALGHVELLRYLLENHDPDIHVGNGKYSNGPTALHVATAATKPQEPSNQQLPSQKKKLESTGSHDNPPSYLNLFAKSQISVVSFGKLWDLLFFQTPTKQIQCPLVPVNPENTVVRLESIAYAVGGGPIIAQSAAHS